MVCFLRDENWKPQWRSFNLQMCIVSEICPTRLKSRQILSVWGFCVIVLRRRLRQMKWDVSVDGSNKARNKKYWSNGRTAKIVSIASSSRLACPIELTVLIVSLSQCMDVRSKNVSSQKVLKLLTQPGAMSHMLTWLEDNDYQEGSRIDTTTIYSSVNSVYAVHFSIRSCVV